MDTSDLNLKKFAKIAENLELLFTNEAFISDTNFKLCAEDYSDECKYMLKNLIKYDKYNLMEIIIDYYFRAVNTAHNVIPERSLLLEILKNFDKNLYEIIKNDKSLNNVIQKFHNVISFEESAINLINIDNAVVSKIISYSHLYLFLDIANQSNKINQLTKYSFEPDYFFHYSNDNMTKELELAQLIVENYLKDTHNIRGLLGDYLNSSKVYLGGLKPQIELVKQEEVLKPKIINNISDNRLYYKGLEKELNNKIIGQEKAISKITRRLKNLEFGIQLNGAKAVYMLLGPTGVGKTEVVKLLNNLLMPKSPLIRLDMSEYKEEHTISKIIGAPPGYTGYTDNKNVLETIRLNPNAIILIDEIEKAHPKVIEVFLHMFDEGKAINNHQQIIDLSNNIFFMTSNIGSFEASKKPIGYTKKTSNKDTIYNSALKRLFSPEFINRINDIVIFENLNLHNVVDIIKLQMREIELLFQTQKEVDININLSDTIYKFLVSKMDFETYGAREVRRILEKYIYSELIDFVVRNGYKDTVINFDFIEEKIIINEEKLVKKHKEK